MAPFTLPLRTLALCLAASLLLPCILACSTPAGGCTVSNCESLKGLTPPYQSVKNNNGGMMDARIGWGYGVYNKRLNGGNAVGSSSKKGGGLVNWEVFGSIDYNYIVLQPNGTVVDTRGIYSLVNCCHMCAKTDGCRVYQFFDSNDWWTIKTQWDVGTPVPTWYAPYNFWGDRQCYLYTGGLDKSETSVGAPTSGTNTQQQQESGWPNRYIAPSWVGGLCNGNPGVVDDPHFTGAHGTKFEFNGEIDETFALITDTRLHVNIKLGGYMDNNTIGATKTVGGKAVRTWIREIGLLWEDAEVVHSAVLTARSGGSTARGGGGFISSIEIDGAQYRAPLREQASVDAGLFSLTLLRQGKWGTSDEDMYELKLDGLLSAKLKARAAHPMLRRSSDAFVHFNVHIDELQATEKVHGVLGQTFRNTVTQSVRALEFRVLNSLLQQPIAADGASGKGFLDGEVGDYKTSGILETDAKFSSFAK